MYKVFLGFLFCTLVPISATADSVSINEAGPEGTAPIVTLSNDPGSSFLLGSSVTAVTCPNFAVLSECWNIDVIVQGVAISTQGTPMGLELSEPGTPGILSDSFGYAAAIPDNLAGTDDIRFQLFSDDPFGNLGGRAEICQLGGCAQAVEDGSFQAANVGITIFNNLQPSTSQSFDVFLKSDVGDVSVDVGTTPEPAAFLLLGSGLLAVVGKTRRQWLR